MKKTISVLLILAMMLATVIAMVPASAVDANATAITDEAGFLAMDANGNYYLDADIELTEIYNATKFAGTLDGNGKKITLSGPKACFNEVNGATIKNLTVAGDVVLTVNTDAAGVALYGYGTFTNITNKVNVSFTLEGDAQYTGKIGGIVAVVIGTTEITNCTNKGGFTVTTNGYQADHYVGGIVGSTDGIKMAGKKLIINGCTNKGNISSNQARAYLGGMIGHANNVRLEMSQCTNSGTISVKQSLVSDKNSAYTGIGGMIGGTWQGFDNSGLSVLLTNCSNAANLQCTNVAGEMVSCVFIGGMIGRGYGLDKFRAINCTNSGNITVPDFDFGWSGAGGMIGSIMSVGVPWAGKFDGKGNGEGEFIMEGCKNTGVISGKEAGGMWGSVYQLFLYDMIVKLQYCVNEGPINATRNAGGLIGLLGYYNILSKVTIKNCWNKGNVTATDRAAGILATIESIGTRGIPTIESCVSTGTIKTTSTSIAAGVGIAAGILGYMPQYCLEADPSSADVRTIVTNTEATVKIKNCVVGGAIQKAANLRDRVAISLANNNITVDAQAPNYYLTNIALNVDFGAAKSADEINTLINAIRFDMHNVEALITEIFKEKSFVSSNYTTASWNAYQTALSTAETIYENFESYTENDITAATNALAAAREGLVALPVNTDRLQLLVTRAETGGDTDYYYTYIAADVLNAKSVLNTATLQSVVNEVANSLETTMLRYTRPVDLTELNGVIAETDNLIESDYVVSSWNALEQALENAEQAKTLKLNSEVASATAELREAIDSLVEKELDFSEYNGLIDSLEDLVASDYTSDSYARLSAELAKKNTVLGYVRQSKIDAASVALEAAINGLRLQTVDLSELNAALSAANALYEIDYTESTWEALEQKIQLANEAKSYTLQSEVDDVTRQLNEAIDGLCLIDSLDFSEYDDVLAIAKAMNKNDYTTASWYRVSVLLEEAEEIAETKYQSKVNDFVARLEDAIENLRADNVDYSQLEAAISRAESFSREDYGESIWQKISPKLEAAKSARQFTLQTDVDRAAQALSNAFIDALIEMINNLNKDDYTEESWDSITQAIAVANMAQASNSQAELDIATRMMHTAVTSLEKKSSNGDSGNGGSGGNLEDDKEEDKQEDKEEDKEEDNKEDKSESTEKETSAVENQKATESAREESDATEEYEYIPMGCEAAITPAAMLIVAATALLGLGFKKKEE